MYDPFTEIEHEQADIIFLRIAESFDAAKVGNSGYLALIKLLAVRSAMIGYNEDELNYILQYVMSHYISYKEFIDSKSGLSTQD